VTPDDLARFRRLCGMLGSAHVGERAAAALKCCEFLGQHGLTWADVTLPVQPVAGAIAPDLEQAVRRANPSRAHQAAKRAAWEQRRYGADEDGFEAGKPR